MNKNLNNDIDAIIAIADDLNLKDLSSDLSFLKSRIEQPNKDVIIPLVGEFSSGKTTLVNTLTDNKQLETASKATTATIFEIRFGCERCYAEIISSDGTVLSEDNIENLKNSALQNVDLVRVYDTSKRVPSGIVLVDTPGLSSSDPKHRLALTNYLPYADAILLLADVNQQITRSLIDFVDNAKLLDRPMYLVVTKCDTKTENEIDSVKAYIEQNIDLPVNHILCVSSAKDDLQDLYNLFDLIQSKKNEIVINAVSGRVKNTAHNICGYIDELIASSKSSSDIDEKIKSMQTELNKLSANIKKLIRDASDSISDKGEECIRRFQDKVFARLDNLVQTQGRDCDEAVYMEVNSVAQTVLLQYKNDLRNMFVNMARERQHSVDAVPLQSLESLDLSEVVLDDLSYNMNLYSIGHKYDKVIGGAVKVAGAVAIVASVVATAGGTAGAIGTAAAGGKLAGKAIDVVDTVTDTASIISNARTRKMVQRTVEYANKFQDGMQKVNDWNNRTGQEYSTKKGGVIETGVEWITDKVWGKPQRRRAVNGYISGTLLPEFTSQIENIRNTLSQQVGQLLQEEAKERTVAMEETLKSLKEESAISKEQFNQRINQLKNYKNTLKNV